MKELMEDVWAVSRNELPEGWEFFRAQPVNDVTQPLKHVCERNENKTQGHPTDIVVLKEVTWSYAKGFYYCTGCKSIFDDEEDLMLIWEDGLGTGQEGIA